MHTYTHTYTRVCDSGFNYSCYIMRCDTPMRIPETATTSKLEQQVIPNTRPMCFLLYYNLHGI